MKTTNNIICLLSAGILLMLATGCDTVTPDAEVISEEELEIAGQIIGESLSDERGGLLSSVYDAVSEVEEESIHFQQDDTSLQNNSTSSEHEHKSGRGRESDFNSDYNPETGEHTIAYRRGFQDDQFSKTLQVHSVYIFTDADGEFLQYPKHHQDLIETIDFKGTREGTASGPRRSSSFSRADTLFLTGVSSASPVLTFFGTHFGEGEMTANLYHRDRVTARSYELHFEFQDIRVDKEVVRENGSLEDGITGFISYRMNMSSTLNGDKREKTLSGTIELTGDGKALLRFDKITDFFNVVLRNGELIH